MAENEIVQMKKYQKEQARARGWGRGGYGVTAKRGGGAKGVGQGCVDEIVQMKYQKEQELEGGGG